MTLRVGIAGTGKMGTAIGCNLLERGYRIWAWNVEPAMMQGLVAAGATPVERLEAMVASVDAVIAMLWDDDVARTITLERIIPAARAGQLVIESTTLSPQMYAALAESAGRRDVDFLAAPVLGSVEGARTGSLTLLPGGTNQAYVRGRELLNAMGSTIHWTGSPLASGHLKLAYNSMLAVNAVAMGELLAIMAAAGVDRALAIDTLATSLERVATKRRQLIERDMQARFSASALVKDLRLAQAARKGVRVAAPLVERACAEFERAVETGAGEQDYIGAALAHERAAR